MAQVKQLPPDLSQRLPRLVPRTRKPEPRGPQAEPPPPTPPLPDPPALSDVAFKHPERKILSVHDHEVFLKSATYELILAFVFGISDSIRNTPISAVRAADQPPIVMAILDILAQAEALVSAHPPEDTGSRFGNPAFRGYLDAVESHQARWHARLNLPHTTTKGDNDNDDAAVANGSSSSIITDEVSNYLQHSFGNKLRIDYGSGHELNFATWLLCLNRLSLLPPPTFPALALLVFPAYIRVMRRVQTTYYLEPAGSHGVWGLDDYQFLPFLFGASQLVGHRYLTPKSIHRRDVLEEFAGEYVYFDQVAFVNGVKNVEGLRWHSPMLDDISAAKGWGKVEAGMRKMFVKEVLGKLPVMQHFLFGGLVPAAEGMGEVLEGELRENKSGGDEVADGEGGVVDGNGMRHVHKPNSWGDCCGIKVPSSAGAMGEMKKRMGGDTLRRIPFD